MKKNLFFGMFAVVLSGVHADAATLTTETDQNGEQHIHISPSDTSSAPAFRRLTRALQNQRNRLQSPDVHVHVKGLLGADDPDINLHKSLMKTVGYHPTLKTLSLPVQQDSSSDESKALMNTFKNAIKSSPKVNAIFTGENPSEDISTTDPTDPDKYQGSSYEKIINASKNNSFQGTLTFDRTTIKNPTMISDLQTAGTVDSTFGSNAKVITYDNCTVLNNKIIGGDSDGGAGNYDGLLGRLWDLLGCNLPCKFNFNWHNLCQMDNRRWDDAGDNGGATKGGNPFSDLTLPREQSFGSDRMASTTWDAPDATRSNLKVGYSRAQAGGPLSMTYFPDQGKAFIRDPRMMGTPDGNCCAPCSR